MTKPVARAYDTATCREMKNMIRKSDNLIESCN